MPDQKYSPCFQCRDPENPEWEKIQTLKYARDTGHLCDLHDAAAEEKIKNFKEVKKYELKPMTSFLPPIVHKPARNWQDREPGSDDV